MQTKCIGTVVTAVLLFALSACSGRTDSSIPATGLSNAPALKHAVHTQQLAVSSCQPCATFQNGPSAEYFFNDSSSRVRRHLVNGIAATLVRTRLRRFG
jgi:hypothetical protein